MTVYEWVILAPVMFGVFNSLILYFGGLRRLFLVVFPITGFLIGVVAAILLWLVRVLVSAAASFASAPED